MDNNKLKTKESNFVQLVKPYWKAVFNSCCIPTLVETSTIEHVV